jgi:hypothetical protein
MGAISTSQTTVAGEEPFGPLVIFDLVLFCPLITILYWKGLKGFWFVIIIPTSLPLALKENSPPPPTTGPSIQKMFKDKAKGTVKSSFMSLKQPC